jgi:ferric iron reductase protein FhuF
MASPREALQSAMTALQPLPRGERLARVSLWTMYYFSALIIPVVERAARTGRVPASAIDVLLCECGADGHVVGFRPRAGARDHGDFDDLVDDHLAVAVEACGRMTGFPARVAWSNAAVVIDYAIAEARAGGDADALREAEALIAGASHPLLARPYKDGEPRERRVCCLRYLLPEGTLCPGICPKAPCRALS